MTLLVKRLGCQQRFMANIRVRVYGDGASSNPDSACDSVLHPVATVANDSIVGVGTLLQ